MAESDSVATMAIAVQRDAWETLCPNLPADVAAMVAPPVTVSSFPVVEVPPAEERRRAKQARFRGNMPTVPPYDRHRRTL
jgi:hypothetical protein